MVGAIIGDYVGSRFEFNNTNSKEFKFFDKKCEFTDDTVMTCAVGQALLDCRNADGRYDFTDLSAKAIKEMHRLGRKFPNAGYGGMFFSWVLNPKANKPYNSFGNGSAMRISAVGDIANTVEEAKELSRKVTEVTHNHPEGIKGAEACAVAKVLLKNGMSKEELKKYIEENYYKMEYTVDQYRDLIGGEHGYEICQVSVPEAFECFFDGDSYEDVIRNCISIGGDSDTIAAIAGGIAEAYYEVPKTMVAEIIMDLPDALLDVVEELHDVTGKF